jgi:hypothetical protein
MVAILARLGHVLFLLGLLLAALIILASLGFIAWGLWDNADTLLAVLENRDWSSLREVLLRVGSFFGISVLIALAPLLVGAACCYILGGFSASQSK